MSISTPTKSIPNTGAPQTHQPHQPATAKTTTFIGLDKTAHTALVANFNGGHIGSFAIRPDFGLGAPISDFLHPETNPNPQHAVKTYPHSFFVDTTNHFAFCPDKGLDKMYLYKFDEKTGVLTPNNPQPFVDSAPGAGPRHVRFHPNGKWVYLLHELGSIIVGYNWDAAQGKTYAVSNRLHHSRRFQGGQRCG